MSARRTRSLKIGLAFAFCVGILLFQADHVRAWEFFTGSANNGLNFGVPGSPAVGDDGTIYVGALTGYFYAINPDGTQKWKFPEGQPGGAYAWSPAIGPNGLIYAGAGHFLFAFDANGAEVHYDAADCLFLGAPAIEDDGTVYIGSNTSKLFAFNPDLTLKWSYQVGYDYKVSDPVIGSDGTIYFKAESFAAGGPVNVQIVAIDRNKNYKWHYYMESQCLAGQCTAPPAIGHDGTIYYTDRMKLYARDRNGNLKWDFTTDYGVTFQGHSSPAIGADNTIYVTATDLSEAPHSNMLYAINSADGSMKWANNSWGHEPGYPAPPGVGANGVIYFGSLDNDFHQVVDHGSYASENILFNTEGQVHSSPAIWYDGSIYVGCALSVKMAQTSSYGPANSSWPLFRGNLKRTAKVKSWGSVQGHIKYLRQLILSYHLASGTTNSLISKLDSADKSLDKLQPVASANALKAFANEVNALKNKKIPPRQAESFLVQARSIISNLDPVKLNAVSLENK